MLKEKQRQERAALILQVAEEVFAEKGYHDASMDEVAARVGVSKGTVYQHFASKEDLVFALFESELEVLQQVIEQAISQQVSARARLEAVLVNLSQELPGKRMQLLMSLFDQVEMSQHLLEKRETMQERVRQMIFSIRRVLEEGIASGEFNSTIPVTVMLITFCNIFSPRKCTWLMAQEHISLEEFIKSAGQVYFQGIAFGKSEVR